MSEQQTQLSENIDLTSKPQLTTCCLVGNYEQLIVSNGKGLEHLEVVLCSTPTTFCLSLRHLPNLKSLKFQTPDDDLYVLLERMGKKYRPVDYEDMEEETEAPIRVVLDNVSEVKEWIWQSALPVVVVGNDEFAKQIVDTALRLRQERGARFVERVKEQQVEIREYIDRANVVVEELDDFFLDATPTEEVDAIELERLKKCLYEGMYFLDEFEELSVQLQKHDDPFEVAFCAWRLYRLRSVIWNRLDDAAYNARLGMDGPNVEGPHCSFEIPDATSKI